MINRFFSWLAGWLVAHPALVTRLIEHCKKHPYFHIYEEGDLYMARFWLIKERWWLPFAIRLHEWHRPDRARHHHDHPCDYRTILLRGWYLELDNNRSLRVVTAGETVSYPREHFHRVSMISQRETTYSLFIYWGRHQLWGFLVNGKKVPWFEYVKNPDAYPADYHQKRGV